MRGLFTRLIGLSSVLTMLLGLLPASVGAALPNRRRTASGATVVKLTPSDGAADDRFGHSVAISGDTVVVGAHGEDAGIFLPNRGSAYVYERNEGGGDDWGQATKLTASGAAMNDYFGYSVSISDDTVIVGAYGKDGGPFSPDHGAAYVYNWKPVDSGWYLFLPLVANDD